ncbi:MAG TPA: helix-turn-helix domain-containing protein [Archangium sp.]|jgi:AraC-like DNA-binding protein|uniref:AraC family transcriptional regulator n=1 Tax=Archangium sp. TaxID=1872627 RepID=UPI002EDA8315
MALLDPDQTERGVFVLSERYEPMEGPWHEHRRAQLIHASEGVLTVRTSEGRWVVPPQRAVWILPGIAHQVSSRKAFWLRTLYVEPGVAPLPAECCVVGVDRLVDELLIAASEFGADYPPGGPEERLIQVILDRLPQLKVSPLYLPAPRDPRLKGLTEALTTNPADGRTLGELAGVAGMTERTVARLFLKETGLTFGQWRRQLRLLAALERLGAGESVSNVALDVGYEDVSSFIAVFKSALGDTPARYFR